MFNCNAKNRLKIKFILYYSSNEFVVVKSYIIP